MSVAANNERALVVSPRALMRAAVVGVLSSLDVQPLECEGASSAELHLGHLAPKLVLADLDADWHTVRWGGFAHWCSGLPRSIALIALAGPSMPVGRVPARCQVLGPDAPPDALARLVASTIGASARAHERSALTERQREVLALVAHGATNHEVGNVMCIATGTVKRHLHDAFTALGARSRVEAVAVARSRGLI